MDCNIIPLELRERDQWVCWKFIADQNGKRNKVPYSTTGRRASTTDCTTWNSFGKTLKTTETVKSKGKPRYDGIGYVFSEGDGIAGIDLDDCLDESGKLKPWATEIIGLFADTYCEISPSKTGLKLFVHGKLPDGTPGRKWPCDDGSIEVYHRGRYFTVTANRWSNASSELRDGQMGIDALLTRFIQPKATPQIHASTYQPPLDRKNVIQRASKYLTHIVPAIEGRGGDCQTFRAACVLVIDFGLTVDEAWPLLQDWNLNCVPPWDQPRLRRKLLEADKREGPRGSKLDERCRDSSPEMPTTLITRCDSQTESFASLKPVSSHAARKSKAEREATGKDTDDSTIAQQLVDIALTQYELFQSPTGQGFAVSVLGPNVALWLGSGRSSIKPTLVRLYHQQTGRIANSTALTDALNLLEGHAMTAEIREVYVRIAQTNDDSIVIDLGDNSGRCVIVSKTDWTIADRSPVTFHRSELTAPFEPPERGGDIRELRSILNVTDQSFLLVVGWLVAAFIPEIAHPIAFLGGQQGVGKSKAALYLTGLIDPSSAPLKVQPRDIEAWALTAKLSWLICIDNLSNIPDWLSDALCRSVTGDGLVRRKKYADTDLSVLSFRRVVLLTSIDAGALRGDLSERLVLIELEPITETSRRRESDLDAEYKLMRPRLFGALLDLVCAVLRKLPEVKLEKLPRMADFAHSLSALDALDALDGSALETYLGQACGIAEDVVDGDLVATAVRDFADRYEAEWNGTATELHKLLTPENRPKDWPKNGTSLAGMLRRVTPALEKVGVHVSFERATNAERTRLIRISRGETSSDASSASNEVTTSDDWGQV